VLDSTSCTNAIPIVNLVKPTITNNAFPGNALPELSSCLILGIYWAEKFREIISEHHIDHDGSLDQDTQYHFGD
jgi:hypothetical protein